MNESETVSPAPPTPTAPAARAQGRSPLPLFLAVVGGLLLFLVAAVLILLLALQSTPGSAGLTSMFLQVTKLPAPALVPMPTAASLIGSDEIQVPLAVPVTLAVDGVELPVQAVGVSTTPWFYQASQPGNALWDYGTLVNYVIGLEPTDANATWMDSWNSDTEFQLILSNGAQLYFGFEQRRCVEEEDTTLFQQTRPELTLILLDTGERVVVTAAYLPAEPASAVPGTMAQVGEAASLDVAQVTVQFVDTDADAPNLPVGSMYLLVDFLVQNTATEPLDTAQFAMTLVDAVGNTYQFSPVASEEGANGLLTGFVGPGEVAYGTAGYIVPSTIPGPFLLWRFGTRSDSPAQAQVYIPYQGPTLQPAAAEVTIGQNDVFLSRDGTSLIIMANVTNVGGTALTVTQDDFNLSSSAGPGVLQQTAPLLPWTIQPSQTQRVEFHYTPPGSTSALFTLLGYTFEISGLPAPGAGGG